MDVTMPGGLVVVAADVIQKHGGKHRDRDALSARPAGLRPARVHNTAA